MAECGAVAGVRAQPWAGWRWRLSLVWARYLGRGASDQPSQVFASQETEPETSELVAATETDAAQAQAGESESDESAMIPDGSTTRFEPLTEVAPPGRKPDLSTVTVDGNGGFVGLRVSEIDSSPKLPFGVGDRTYHVMRSTDGETWEATHRWHTGPWTVERITKDGSRWFAALRIIEGNPSTSTRLQLAISSDLATWSHREVPLDFDDRASELGIDLRDVSRFAWIDGALGSDETVAQVNWYLSAQARVAPADGSSGCGDGLDERGLFQVRCDGSISIILTGDQVLALNVNRSRMFVGQPGEPLVASGPGPRWHIGSLDQGFFAVDDDLSAVVVSEDGFVWENAGEVGSTIAEASYWAPVGAHGSQVMLLGRDIDTRTAQLIWFDVGTAEMTPVALPIDLTFNTGIQAYYDEDTGWALVANRYDTSLEGVVSGDWQLTRRVLPGRALTSPYMVYPRTRSDVRYLVYPESRGIEQGLFGELRFRRPGTDEVLIEVADGRDKLLPVSARAERPAVLVDGTYELDGWTMTGDPFHGPLTVTSPEGTERVLSDGYLATNQDTRDGFELVGGTADRAEQGRFTVFDEDDAELWRARFGDVIDALTVDEDESDAGDEATAPGTEHAWLLQSIDGVDWSVLWTGVDANLTYPELVVGDAAVIVHQRSVPEDFVVVPLDAD